MEIINPNFVLREKNAFNLRKLNYESIMEMVRIILIPAQELGFEITKFKLKDHKFSSGE